MKQLDRNDPHCPKNLQPADYEFVGAECIKIDDLGDAMFARQQREIIAAHMAKTGGNYSRHEHGGNCGVCGNTRAIYTVLFCHAKTNSYVRTGQECAELIDAGTVPHFAQLRKSVAHAREFQRGKQKAAALLADHNLSAAWDIYAADATAAGREEQIIRDIVGKLVHYGSISEKQFELVAKLLGDIPLRAERLAQRQAETDAAAPCPTGRMIVSGEILSVRVDDTPYGMVTKMLVKADEGFKVWGSMPAGTHGNKGDKVKFTATLTPSSADPKFGFAKRPVLIETSAAAAQPIAG